MEDTIFSPVPKEQIPLKEFIELKKSVFFSWPTSDLYTFYKKIIVAWVSIFPLFLLITSGSYSIKENIIKLISISFLASTIIPFTILIRLYLGWGYIYKRLLSSYIAYEESDWHDGQIWKKPESWKVRDNLVASKEVLPIISKLQKSIIILLITILPLINFTTFKL